MIDLAFVGTLAMHWNADHLVLWQSPVTRPSLILAHIYYNDTLVKIPSLFQMLHYSVGTSGAALLVIKVLGGRESNWLFDGASLCKYLTLLRKICRAHNDTLVLYGAVALAYVQKVMPSMCPLFNQVLQN